MPAATAPIGPISVLRTGISTRWCREVLLCFPEFHPRLGLQQQFHRKRLRSFDRGWLPDCVGNVARIRAAGKGVWQRVSFNNTVDPVSTISFDNAGVFTGRAGALLRGTFGTAGTQWQPYLKGNVWWGSNGFDTVTFGIDPVQTGRQGGTAVEGVTDPQFQCLWRCQLFDRHQRRVSHCHQGQC